MNKLENRPTIFFGNEFLDSLPIKQYFKNKKRWYERFVEKKGGNYNFTKINCDIKKIEKKFNLKISKKQNFFEISLEQFKIIKKLNSIIKKHGGCMLFIDYAYSSEKIFDTLQAVKNHKMINVLKEVSNADISHLINIPLLNKIVTNLNLKLNFTTQRKFLLNLGIMKRAEILATKKKFLEKSDIFYRVHRLIDKKQMGELFKVIYIYKKRNEFELGFK